MDDAPRWKRCCCGRLNPMIMGGAPLIINDTMHEVLGPEGNFCGPVINHKLRDAEADNLRLSNLVTKFDTALRTIATEAGMEEAYSGVDTDESLENFVKAVKELRGKKC